MNVSYYCRLVLNDPGVPGEPNEMEMRKTEEKIPSPPLKKADDGESEGKKLSAFLLLVTVYIKADSYCVIIILSSIYLWILIFFIPIIIVL